jgi:hypothetical protein
MNTIKTHRNLSLLVISSLGLAIFLFSTNPESVALGLLVVPVALFFLISYAVTQMAINFFNLVRGQPHKRKLVAIVTAGLLTVIMILQSTGGISGADVLLLALIIPVAFIYIEKF